MYPLPAHTVNLVLQYISPLTDQLPPHLISTPLRQRHHYLQLSTSNPVEYLCWPSPDNLKVADFFDQLSSLPLDDQGNYPTRYTSDSESTFAHVQLTPDTHGLRFLFLWDESDGWKYHDTQLMPFPSSSFSTLQEALVSNGAARDILGQLSRLDHISEAHCDSDSGDDSYWDSYGAAADDVSPLESTSISKPDGGEGEDAYWAQYASVQGSADSTVPSPLPNHRKLRPPNFTGGESGSTFPSQSNPVINIPVHTVRSSTAVTQLGPPSPDTLTHLLTLISPRRDVYSPILDEPTSTLGTDDPSSDLTTTDSELITPPSPDGHHESVVVSHVAVKIDGVSPPSSHDEEEDKALTDSIKGLYFLWKSGKNGGLSDKNSHAFLRIVQAAIKHE